MSHALAKRGGSLMELRDPRIQGGGHHLIMDP